MVKMNNGAYNKIVNALDINGNESVFEIGYGHGLGLEQILSRYDCSVSGIDFSELMYKQASKRIKSYIDSGKANLSYGDFLDTEMPLEKFNKIFCLNVVYFWKELEIPFAKIRNGLKEKGCFCFYMEDADELNRQGFAKKDLFDIPPASHFDIAFSMGTCEHFTDDEMVAMIDKMRKIATHVIIGVPWNGSHTYMVSKEFSQAMGTWEYGVEHDFRSLVNYHDEFAINHESTIGTVSEAMYLKRVNETLIQVKVAMNLKKMHEGKQVGSWLVSMSSTHEELELNKVTDGVTVIVPVYNAEKYIDQLTKTLYNWVESGNSKDEIIVVDDCSTDNTVQMLSHEGIIAIELPKNVGDFEARFEGLKHATNNYIYNLDADDLIFPGSITTMMQDIKSCPEGTYLTNSCALMVDGKFNGNIWIQPAYQSVDDIVDTELAVCEGKLAFGSTIIRKDLMEKTFKEYHRVLAKAGVERMEVGADSLFTNIMVMNGDIKQVLPVYYTYRGYTYDMDTLSHDITKRVRDLPLFLAYLFNKSNGTPEVAGKMKDAINKAYQQDAPEFIANFKKYRGKLNGL